MEAHILSHHREEKKHIVESVFVNEGVFDEENKKSNENGPNDESNEANLPPSKTEIKEFDKRKRKRGRKSGQKLQPTKGPMFNVFYCDICPDITLSTLNVVRQHMKRHIQNKVRKSCSICKKKPRNFDKHLKMVHMDEKLFKCDYCNDSFRSNNNRINHMRIHTNEKPFLCETCGKSFSSFKIKCIRKNGHIHASALIAHFYSHPN